MHFRSQVQCQSVINFNWLFFLQTSFKNTIIIFKRISWILQETNSLFEIIRWKKMTSTLTCSTKGSKKTQLFCYLFQQKLLITRLWTVYHSNKFCGKAFWQRVWESFPPSFVGTPAWIFVGNHMGTSQFGPPIINIFRGVPVAQDQMNQTALELIQ
jgi:hypothetical protein